jgi:carbon-monoxide dehydrogenase catalytic subunit
MFKQVSAHESIREMYGKAHEDGITNVFDRYQAQGDKRCPFCSSGVRCDLCSNGPCRIQPKADRGVCGIDADGMSMRMMLLRNILGAQTYAYHANEVFKTLIATGEDKTPYRITDEGKLRRIARELKLGDSKDAKELAVLVGKFFLEDMHRDQHNPSRMVETYAPAKRKEVWRKTGVFPGGLFHDLNIATSSCLTNIDGYYASLAMKAIRIGIGMAYEAQLPLEWGQDVLFGTAVPHEVDVDLGVIDPDYVNIIPSGHEPFFGALFIELARKPEYQEMAKKAGAKGMHVIASIETGQELIQRYSLDNAFVGFTGNWLNQEMVLATGAVDLFAADMNCSMPTLGLYQKKYNVSVVPVSELVRIEGCDLTIDYIPEKAKEQAEQLIKIAVENFKRRKASGATPHVPKNKTKAIVGFSTDSILAALGGSLDPLLGVIKNGTIKGIAGLVSCTTLKNSGQDETTIAVAKELIKRDILVLGMGCGVGAMQVGGLCNLDAIKYCGPGLKGLCGMLGVPPVLSFGTCTDTGRAAHLLSAIAGALNVDIPALPVVITAPEWMEQKATIDAVFAVGYGLYTHLSPVPTITGAPRLVQLLTKDMEEVFGGKVDVVLEPDFSPEAEAKIAVDRMEASIMSKRKALGI